MSKIPCPECSRPMDRLSKRCAICKGYGLKRHVMPNGYMRVYTPGHPVANADGYALEHRVVLYDAGVTLAPGFHVHHRNEYKADNRLENLEVLTAAEHVRLHAQKVGVVNQYGTWPLRGTA